MLTLNYSSPEQIRGDPIATPGDVYSMAVVSCELLTGTKPYELGVGSIAQAAKAIVEIVPQLASEVAVPSRRGRLRGDLDAVLNKALKKGPAERYASMAELADDIEVPSGRGRPHPTGTPLLGRRASPSDRWIDRSSPLGGR